MLGALMLGLAVAGPAVLKGPVEASLGPDEVHEHGLKLKPGRFVHLDVEQDGVDVVLRVVDPTGVAVAFVDSATGTAGAEHLSWHTELGGRYTVEVLWLSGAGDYRISAPSVTPRAEDSAGRARQVVETWGAREGRPGFAWGIAVNGEVVDRGTAGLAQLEYGIPLTTATPIHVASLSKPFTAWAATRMEQRGVLDLSADARQWVPELPDFGAPISLEHLARHTSGLRDQWTLLGLSGVASPDVIRTDHILELVRRQKGLNHPVGADFSYTNTGYTLLALAVERETGGSLDAFLQAELFGPLGMESSRVFADHTGLIAGRAYGYTERSGTVAKSELNFGTVGPSSLFSSVDDLLRWCAVLGEDSPEMAAMRVPTVLADGTEVAYGRGLSLASWRGLDAVGHDGLDGAFTSALRYFPESGACFVVLSNAESVNAVVLRDLAAQAWFDGALEPARFPDGIGDLRPADPEQPEEPVTVDPADFVGAWQSPELDAIYRVEERDGVLWLTHVRAGAHGMRAVDVDRFRVGRMAVDFERDAEGRVVRMWMTVERARAVGFERL